MESNSGTFKVVYLEPVRRFLKECVELAKLKNLGAEVLRALLDLDQRLRKDPREFGDPWNRYGNLEIYHRTFVPFDVVYGVHAVSNLVFVRAMRTYPFDYFG